MEGYFFGGLVIGIIGGGVGSYLYASSVIADYKKAANKVGVVFQLIEGEWTAIKKAL